MKKTVPAVADDVRPAPQAAPQGESRPFYTVAEIQQRIPVSRRTIYSWRKAGWLPSVQTGSKILFHWPSVEAALLRRQRGGVA